MRNLVDENKLNFDLLALKIRTAYMKASISSNDKVIIFNLLVDWVMSKIHCLQGKHVKFLFPFCTGL